MTQLTIDSFCMAEYSDDTVQEAERRRGLRILQNRPIKVLDPAGVKYFGGQTLDISATGLRVKFPRNASVRMGELLNIHVGQNGLGNALANRRQMIPARVVWISLANDKLRTMSAGLEFSASMGAQLDAA